MAVLREKMIADMTTAGLSASTKEAYKQGFAALLRTIIARPIS
jgi:hypothetical protein